MCWLLSCSPHKPVVLHQGEPGDNREGLGPVARNQALKRFYSHLSTYLDLSMWKVRRGNLTLTGFCLSRCAFSYSSGHHVMG